MKNNKLNNKTNNRRESGDGSGGLRKHVGNAHVRAPCFPLLLLFISISISSEDKLPFPVVDVWVPLGLRWHILWGLDVL